VASDDAFACQEFRFDPLPRLILRELVEFTPTVRDTKFKIALMAFDCISGQCPVYTSVQR